MKKILIFGLCMLTFISLAFAVTDTIDSFYNQDNPFNFSLETDKTYYINLLSGSYINNLTLKIKNFDNCDIIIKDYMENSSVGYNSSLWSKTGTGTIVSTTNLKKEQLRSLNISASGSSDISIKNYTGFSGLNNFTLDSWIYIKSSSETRVFAHYIEDTTNIKYNYIQFRSDVAGNNWMVYDNGNIDTGHAIRFGEWINIKMYYNNGNLTYYDGNELIYSANHPINFTGINITLSPAKSILGNNYYVDALRIYKGFNCSYIDLRTSNTNYSFFQEENYLDRTNESNNILESGCICSNCLLINKNCRVGYTFSGINTTIELNLTNLTYSYGLDNCSNSFNIPSNATALNLSFFDSSGNPTNVSLEGNILYGSGEYLINPYSVSNEQYCIYPSWSNLYADFNFEFSDNYASYSYNTFQANLTNITQQVNLYTQDNTTYQCLITVYDTATDPISNVYVEILKQNIAENSFITTEILKTDSSGHALGNFELGTSYYRMILEQNGSVVLTDNSSLMIPSTSCEYTCCKNFFLSQSASTWFDNSKLTSNVLNSLYYNEATGYFIFNWNDPTNLMHYACLKITKTNLTGVYTMSNSCTMSSSGTLYYSPVNESGARYDAISYLKFDDLVPVGTAEKVFPAQPIDLRSSKLALFLGGGIILVLFFIGILIHPIIATLFLVVGVIISFSAQMFSLSLAGLSTIVILWLVNEVILHRKR